MFSFKLCLDYDKEFGRDLIADLAELYKVDFKALLKYLPEGQYDISKDEILKIVKQNPELIEVLNRPKTFKRMKKQLEIAWIYEGKPVSFETYLQTKTAPETLKISENIYEDYLNCFSDSNPTDKKK